MSDRQKSDREKILLVVVYVVRTTERGSGRGLSVVESTIYYLSVCILSRLLQHKRVVGSVFGSFRGSNQWPPRSPIVYFFDYMMWIEKSLQMREILSQFEEKIMGNGGKMGKIIFCSDLVVRVENHEEITNATEWLLASTEFHSAYPDGCVVRNEMSTMGKLCVILLVWSALIVLTTFYCYFCEQRLFPKQKLADQTNSLKHSLSGSLLSLDKNKEELSSTTISSSLDSYTAPTSPKHFNNSSSSLISSPIKGSNKVQISSKYSPDGLLWATSLFLSSHALNQKIDGALWNTSSFAIKKAGLTLPTNLKSETSDIQTFDPNNN